MRDQTVCGAPAEAFQTHGKGGGEAHLARKDPVELRGGSAGSRSAVSAMVLPLPRIHVPQHEDRDARELASSGSFMVVPANGSR